MPRQLIEQGKRREGSGGGETRCRPANPKAKGHPDLDGQGEQPVMGKWGVTVKRGIKGSTSAVVGEEKLGTP